MTDPPFGGKRIAIIGSSGSGKTVLAHPLAQHLNATSLGRNPCAVVSPDSEQIWTRSGG
jgi:nicotinamide riboside kinase